MARTRVVFSIGALHGGGSERQIVSTLTHLDREQFEPFLYVIYRAGPLLSLVPQDVPLAAFEERDSRPATRVPGGMHRRRIRDMKRYLREVNADVSYDRTFLMTLVAAEAAQSLGVPNVSTIVTDPATGFAPVAGRFQWFKKRSLRRLYESSAAVLAVSDGAARSAESFYGLTPGRVATQYNGVDVKFIRQVNSEPESEWWNRPALENRKLMRIVSAGRLNHEKGFHLLIDAIALLQKEIPAVEFRVAFLGEGEHRSTLQRQIDRHGLSDQVSLEGFQRDAGAWFASADLFVLPSLVEGMPNVLLEAMACGTPVLASRCPHGPEEILRNNDYGLLCEPNSIESLADGIRQVISDDAATQRRTTAASSRIDSDFSQQVAVRRLEKILQSAAKPSKETDARYG